jgi:hypothetical protein
LTQEVFAAEPAPLLVSSPAPVEEPPAAPVQTPWLAILLITIICFALGMTLGLVLAH